MRTHNRPSGSELGAMGPYDRRRAKPLFVGSIPTGASRQDNDLRASARNGWHIFWHITSRRPASPRAGRFPPYERRPSLVPRARDVHRRGRSCRERFSRRRRVVRGTAPTRPRPRRGLAARGDLDVCDAEGRVAIRREYRARAGDHQVGGRHGGRQTAAQLGRCTARSRRLRARR